MKTDLFRSVQDIMMFGASRNIRSISAVLLISLLAACSGQKMGEPSGNATGSGSVQLHGNGATFPKPIYEKWVFEYGKIDPNVKIDYQGNGSGAGQKALLANTADFGASDDPMSDEDLRSASGEIIHIPTVLGAVAVTYNLGSIKEPLKLSGQTIADIYLGNIKKWNDPKLVADNPDMQLPDAEILPVYRADASGTSAVFTDFLSRSVPVWKEKVGVNKQPSWISGVGIGAKGNDGVMGQVKQTPNSIGYVELTFAEANSLPTALIRNRDGNFVAASLESVTTAAKETSASMPADLRMQITDAPGKDAYPIASYTYILVFKDQPDAAKGKALVDFLWWAVHDGTRFTSGLHYAPLPPDVLSRVEEKLRSITSNGKQLKGQ